MNHPGFAFLMDYNEDRQVDLDYSVYGANTDGSYGSKIDGSNDNNNAFIYLNTIGNHNQFPISLKIFNEIIMPFCRNCQTYWWRKIQSEWNKGDQSYRILPRTGPRCQRLPKWRRIRSLHYYATNGHYFERMWLLAF